MNNMKKTAVSHKPGDIIELAGIKFVVLEDRGPVCSDSTESELFIMALESQGQSIFGDTNNYAESDLRRRVAGWLDELLDHGVNPDFVRSRVLDLTTLDGHGKYGTLETKAAPLTMDEARKYADVIPDPDEVCWLATGWGGPGYFGSALALLVRSNGDWYSRSRSSSYGIRPALVISSLLLTSEDEPDLSEFSTDELLAEVRRRIEE